MNGRTSAMWFRIVTAILTLFGLFFIFFGLRVFSDAVPLIPHEVLLPWTSALYGTVMVGWGVTLFLVGHIAFRRNDHELKRALLAGLAAWLVLEAAASAWFGVWFNVGVDIVVFILFAFPLFRADSA
jgi:heme/copper-type cytochrome/quinol oxidase subunit 3